VCWDPLEIFLGSDKWERQSILHCRGTFFGWLVGFGMGVSKPTEMTIRDLLQEELRKRGVTVVPEFSVSTPTGVLKPDILLKNGAPYVVETKLGAETKLLEAMVKLYDYSKYVTEAKGAFAVLFPQELLRPCAD